MSKKSFEDILNNINEDLNHANDTISAEAALAIQNESRGIEPSALVQTDAERETIKREEQELRDAAKAAYVSPEIASKVVQVIEVDPLPAPDGISAPTGFITESIISEIAAGQAAVAAAADRMKMVQEMDRRDAAKEAQALRSDARDDAKDARDDAKADAKATKAAKAMKADDK